MTTSSILISSGSRSQKLPLRISFAETPTVHTLPNLSLTSQEVESVWYSQHELNVILQECGQQAAAALLFLPDAADSATSMTMRGLELMTPQGFSLAILHDDFAHQVLQEQARLRGATNDVDVSQALATFQQQSSTHRQRIAHLRGLADAQAVGQNMPMKYDPSQTRRALSLPDRRRRRSERLRPSLVLQVRTGSNRSLI